MGFMIKTITCIIMIAAGIMHIMAILACRAETTATYIKYNTIQNHGGKTYEPVFRYSVNGEEFQGRCLNAINLPDIQKQFAAGQTYTIYVNVRKPGFFVIHRRVPVLDIFVVLIGILLLAFVFITR